MHWFHFSSAGPEERHQEQTVSGKSVIKIIPLKERLSKIYRIMTQSDKALYTPLIKLDHPGLLMPISGTKFAKKHVLFYNFHHINSSEQNMFSK